MESVKDLVGNKHKIDLKKNFIEHLSDKDFKNYVANLDIPEEKLYKYTSLLSDCVNERKLCKNCPGLLECPNSVSGYVLTPSDAEKRILFSYVPCSKNEEYLNATKNITYYDVSRDIKVASFKNLYKDDKDRIPIIKFFKDFMDSYKKGENPKGLFLTGSFGTGKTYLIAALFNELSKKGYKSTIIYYPEFLRNLKSSFNSDEEEKFDYVKRSPILLIDDIGAENCSGWNRDEVLSPILQYRMEEHLPTFFTSNFNLEELEDHLAHTGNGVEKVKARRIMERIKQTSDVLTLITKNRRG